MPDDYEWTKYAKFRGTVAIEWKGGEEVYAEKMEAVQDAPTMWEFCSFMGDPPRPHKSWVDFMCSGYRSGVVIMTHEHFADVLAAKGVKRKLRELAVHDMYLPDPVRRTVPATPSSE